ncbi:uncharacterized protein H6S33_005852 [Morchella sextelata]|uniref:uncharacterized protein n=1 Tax=Morchella sextelata TaxID=1174677 RepID=UPI001D0491A9|nr:uncharacterized protein H6S33_005852 [Morchella sextelata]KAH0613966.1 hypothetical protein H6S33_005852 [Morchella sextelata]
MTASVKRSLSTPNVQQAAAMAAEGPSSTSGLPYSTGKGRNKLGYHRTSVACGHCRRRKIRCLLAKDDLHGRCSNCIRLKKECNFYPVENTDRRPRSMSKPDINSQDSGSSGSSPSPGFGPGQLSENANGYPVSVPVTPTWGAEYEFGPGAFEHQFLQNGISRPGRIMGLSQSASVSRRPSMAQMHTPATVKVEPGYSDLVPRWELPSQPESSADFSSRAPLEDPSLSSVIWRATSGPMTGNNFSQQNISNTPLPTDSIENFEEGIWTSQAPSRMGSIDQGMNLPFSYQSAYSSDVDLGIPPEMYSASASTASLTASVSESSHYGDHQFYSTQWPEHGAVGNGCDMEGMRLDSDTFDQASFADEEPYIGVDGGSPYYPSPLQGTAPVSMSQR